MKGWILEKDFRFEAAHQLPNHEGQCRRLHGHSWRGTVRIAGSELMPSGSSAGMVLDYRDINRVLQPLVDKYLDHHFLNETLGIESPTSEEVARWVYHQVERSPIGPLLVSVTIEETCTARCTFC